MGSPSLYFVFSVPQDGIANPADYNATVSGYLRTIWNHSAAATGAGTLTGPDTDGYYTGTLTGVTIPANAVMLTGGWGTPTTYTSTLPLTQTNLEKYPVTAPSANPAPALRRVPDERVQQGGLIVIAPNAQKVATGFTAGGHRRGRTLQQVPPGARHLHPGCVPRRTAKRRDHLLVVPHAKQDEQRLVGGFHLLRPRHSRRREATEPLHLGRHQPDRFVRQRRVPGSPEGLPDLPPPWHVRLQRQRFGNRPAEQAAPDGGHRCLQWHGGSTIAIPYSCTRTRSL